jgi:tRNA (guanine37-N1)-methyltransferase
MKFQVLTLFPEMFDAITKSSIIGRAVEKMVLDIELINIRDYSKNKHKKVDDYPYGGGAGMVMQCQPIYDAYQERVLNCNENKKPLVIYLSPRGEVFNHEMAVEFASHENIVLLCGHYEGVDQRILDMLDVKEVSIGDYVLTGGELAAMVLIDSISRFVPNVLGANESVMEESFSNGLLEYPQYTRPEEFMDAKVPEVLLSGHHKNIEKWRYEQSLMITKNNRPDLL